MRATVINVCLLYSMMGCGQQCNNELGSAVVKSALSGHILSQDTADATRVLKQLVAKTRFANKININQSPDPERINFYMLGHHLSAREDLPLVIIRSGILGNCAFVGFANAIVCDSDFLSTFLDDHRVFTQVSSTVLVQFRQDYQLAFLAWVLGHEVGHIMAGDCVAHFGEAHILDQQRRALVLAQKQELDADNYSAKQIGKDRDLTRKLESMLISLLNEEVIAKAGIPASVGVGLNWDYANKQIIQYFTNQDHPEYVVRGTRMLQRLATITKDPGLQNLVGSFSMHLMQSE